MSAVGVKTVSERLRQRSASSPTLSRASSAAPVPINTHLKAVIISSFTLARTLAPPLALDDDGDKALHCRNLSDAVFTPTADIVFSAVAVGVLHRQVRARWTELLGLLFISSSSSLCGNYNSIFTTFLIFKIYPIYQKWFLPTQC